MSIGFNESKGLHDPNHPIWALARLIVMMVALTVVLKFQAQNFDKTEIQTIITMFVVAGGVEGVTTLFSRMKGGG